MRVEREGIFFCLSSPAGAGKTTISESLLRDATVSVKRVVTCTSRERRPLEVEGQSYHFLSKDEFIQGVDGGAFFEWEEVHGNLYGTRLIDLEGSEDKLVVIDIRGALSFKRAFPERSVLTIVVPPRPEDLKFRLLSRGTENEQQLEKRLETAKREYEMFLGDPGKIDYLIVNDALPDAIGHFKAIIEAESLRFRRLKSSFISEVSRF
jgi:guanylate kinase